LFASGPIFGLILVSIFSAGVLSTESSAPAPQAAACAAGSEQFARRQFVVAQSLLWDCIISGSDSENSALNLTLTYRELKNYQAGTARADAELKSAPHNEDVLYVAAYLLFRQGQSNKSLELLAQAYRLKPGDWRVHQLFALDFIELKMESFAEPELLRASKLNPNAPEVYYQLGRLYYGQNRFQESIAASERAVAVLPDYAEAYDSLGLAYQAINDIPQATANYTRAIDIDRKTGSKDEWPLINYATLFLTNSPEQAEAVLREALQLNPRNPQANYDLGQVLKSMGRGKDAEPFFEQALDDDPTFASAYYALAMLIRKEEPARSSQLLKQFELLTNPQREKATH
jgi:tetratricopeptide (TPR) repeat protein